jgi:ELWxxDGT repeat protein
LWKTDGTRAGTVRVKAFPDYYSLFNERCVADGKLFFNTSQMLWVSDGTEAGTHLVSDAGLNGVSQVTNLVAANNTVFSNGYSDKYSYELYAGDATKLNPTALLTNQNFYKKSSSFSATLLQNPIVGVVRMNVVSDQDQTINITVSNAIGNVIAQQKVVLYKGSNNVQLNAANWQAGIYLIKLYNAVGDAASVQVLK